MTTIDPEDRLTTRRWDHVVATAIDDLANHIRQIDGSNEMGAEELAERIIRDWMPSSRLVEVYAAKAADTGAAEIRSKVAMVPYWLAQEGVALQQVEMVRAHIDAAVSGPVPQQRSGH